MNCECCGTKMYIIDDELTFLYHCINCGTLCEDKDDEAAGVWTVTHAGEMIKNFSKNFFKEKK